MYINRYNILIQVNPKLTQNQRICDELMEVISDEKYS